MRITLALLTGLLLTQVASAEPDAFGLGTGRDGALTVTSGRSVQVSGAVMLGRNAAAGATQITASGLKISVGDLVMLHDTTGFRPLPASGDGKTVALDPTPTGRWELARVKDVTTVITLTAPLRFAYTSARTQVLRVAEYTEVVIEPGARLFAAPWLGKGNGILAMLVTGKVTNEGRIDADGAGFQGGVFQAHTAGLAGCTGLDLSAEQGGSPRGEGVAGTVSSAGLSTGRGNLANGGGGGNCANAGGGGGGHGGVGGVGGRTSGADGQRVEGGLGGAPLSYSVFERFSYGGGGGAGESYDATTGSSGGQGGVVLIRATAFQGSGSYSSNGADAAAALGDNGAGGGGAGGSVQLRATDVLVCGKVEARGGQGGAVRADTQPQGPGGGGAGGRVLLQGRTLSCASSVNAGNAGTSSFPGAGSHGATPTGVSSDAGVPDGGFDAGVPGVSAGTVTELTQAYAIPGTPVIDSPAAGEVLSTTRPRYQGRAGTNGPLVHVVVDGREVGAAVPGADGAFSLAPNTPLSPGAHAVHAWAESLGVASANSTAVRFTSPQVVLADGGAVGMAVLVVPANGDTVGPTPLFAGTASNGVNVGVVIDDGPDHIVPLDLLGRFRYQAPDSEPLAVGVHKVTVHAHNESGEDGPYSEEVAFEVGVGSADGGTDGGTGTDAGTADPAVPMLVVPAQDASLDPTFTFVGVVLPGTTVQLELDGAALALATADDTGVFRHVVEAKAALPEGAHRVLARVVTATGEAGPRSPEVGFQVRGPTHLDVGCGCGSAPAGMLSAWVLVGLTLLARRRARR